MYIEVHGNLFICITHMYHTYVSHIDQACVNTIYAVVMKVLNGIISQTEIE